MKKYGWRKDQPDHRDFLYMPVDSKVVESLPEKIDLTNVDSNIYDQGDLGSCTAQASAGCIEHNNLDYIPSRLFIYYNTRIIEHTVNYDSGASLRNTIKAIVRNGYCNENLWPYHIDEFTTRPSQSAFKSAKMHKIIYSRIPYNNLNLMKLTLSNGVPFIFGFSVYESFEKIGSDGIMLMPSRREHLLGGHAVMAVGYNDLDCTMLIRNSWGSEWGLCGYFKMPYEFIASRDLADDFWVIDIDEENNIAEEIDNGLR